MKQMVAIIVVIAKSLQIYIAKLELRRFKGKKNDGHMHMYSIICYWNNSTIAISLKDNSEYELSLTQILPKHWC